MTAIAPTVVIAGNGTNDIGYGAESGGMAGADLAVARDTAALNINPAGLTQIRDRAFDFDIEPFYLGRTRHRDQYGNDKGVGNLLSAIASGGYAQRLPGSSLVAGVGLFAQGGAGFSYDDLNTAFGTQDELSATFGSFKIEPGFGWQLGDSLSLGASLGITYSMAREKFFPDTSVADPSGATAPFFGIRVDGAGGWSSNGKVGFQYRPNPNWTLAGAYTSKTRLKLEGGDATVNYEAIGQGRVVYRDASLAGLTLAQEAGIGVAYRPNPAWLLSTEINWVDWSSAMRASTLMLSKPDNADVPQDLSLTSRLDWHDQYVFAIGAEYRWSPSTSLRFGYNYGRNPIPAQTLNPALAVTANRTFAVGFSHDFTAQWQFSSCLYYQPIVEMTYTNPELPLGADAYNRWEGLIAQFVVSRRW
ncbi:outer membrane protein transport protein [Hydrocarboniphaga sp.]|uniref:OmpP1/FadL family transporter n=1 Tax=Hydrocarboniphaga sp. TaxID=2033016 RepID=UPI00260717B1|nr:outer membrane protein transport protein [Hydrocarboniphaga sp.]